MGRITSNAIDYAIERLSSALREVAPGAYSVEVQYGSISPVRTHNYVTIRYYPFGLDSEDRHMIRRQERIGCSRAELLAGLEMMANGVEMALAVAGIAKGTQ